MFDFKLPDIGEGLHEAELLEWDVKVGDNVAEGDPIAQVSTDKVNVDLPSPCAGVIAELPWKPGDIIPVGAVLARIDDGKGAGASSAVPDTEEGVKPALKVQQRKGRFRVKAVPAVRRYAAEKGVNLEVVAPTGPADSVLKEDVDSYLAKRSEAGPEALSGGVTRTPLTGPRLAAAKLLETSWRTLATTSMTFEVEADALLAECEKLVGENESIRITPLALIASCVCGALAEHPTFNAVIDEHDRALFLHKAVNLGIAVDSDDGLLVPVIPGAQEKSPAQLAQAIEQVANEARAGALAVKDFRGSTFTISSTGSLEEAAIIATTPVINFPNVATLWMSRVRERPRVVDGKLEVGPMMSCTLAFDHRFIHGADATRFINSLVRMISRDSSAP